MQLTIMIKIFDGSAQNVNITYKYYVMLTIHRTKYWVNLDMLDNSKAVQIY